MRGTDFMELRAFELVARHQSFTRAADHLGVSRAAISNVVKNLEKRLGIQLLTRTTRSVALTDAGRELLDRLSPALNELVGAVAHIDQFRDKPMGRIRLLTCHLAAELHLTTLVPAFADAQPEVSLEICIKEGDMDMVAEGFDAAIFPEGKINQDLIAAKIGPGCEQVVVASTDYLRRRGSIETLPELHNHSCIKVVTAAAGDGDWRLIGPEGPVRMSITESVRVNSFAFAMQVVLGGMGVALVPKALAAPALDDGSVQRLFPAFSGQLLPFYFCYPKHHCSTLAFRSLVDFVRERPTP